jgi:trimeric autotransporter adhesin
VILCKALLALRYNTSGSQNLATGTHALYKNTTGNYNAASGHGALYSNTKGIGNTAIGSHALFNNTTGTYNTAVGYGAGPTSSLPNLINSTAVGYQATTTASNQVRIDNSAVTSIGGYANWSKLSDGRYKKDIQEDVPGLEFITQLRPVTYAVDVKALDQALKPDASQLPDPNLIEIRHESTAEEIAAKAVSAKIIHTGLVAQEVEATAKKLGYEFSGIDKPKNDQDFYGLRYAEFVVPLVKAVQELNKKTEEENQQLKQQVVALQERVTRLGALITGNINTSINLSAAYLEQSTPNPAGGITLIRYYVPQNSGTAHLVFTDIKGAIIKSITLNHKGAGQLSINTAAWTAGTYTYTLYINGTQADSKKLVIAR